MKRDNNKKKLNLVRSKKKKKSSRMGEKSKYSRANHIDMNIVEFTCSKSVFVNSLPDHFVCLHLLGVRCCGMIFSLLYSPFGVVATSAFYFSLLPLFNQNP